MTFSLAADDQRAIATRHNPMRVYHGTTIEPRDYRGYYRARVLVGSSTTGYYVPLQADSLSGIKQAITETLARREKAGKSPPLKKMSDSASLS